LATAVQKVNQKPLPKKPIDTGYTIKDQWGDLKLQKGNKLIFSARINMMACCAFNEISGFSFGKDIRYSKTLQEWFNKFVQKCHEQEEGSVQIFILNKNTVEENAKQPKWFIECLENYPGSWTMPWLQNMTHSGKTSVKMYLLPTYEEIPIEDLKEKALVDDEYDYD
jgi:hypothetical protein